MAGPAKGPSEVTRLELALEGPGGCVPGPLHPRRELVWARRFQSRSSILGSPLVDWSQRPIYRALLCVSCTGL